MGYATCLSKGFENLVMAGHKTSKFDEISFILLSDFRWAMVLVLTAYNAFGIFGLIFLTNRKTTRWNNFDYFHNFRNIFTLPSSAFSRSFSFLFCLRRFPSIINSKRHPFNLMDFKRFFFVDVLISKIISWQRVLNAILNHYTICLSWTIFDLLCYYCCWDFVQWVHKKLTTITWQISANREWKFLYYYVIYRKCSQ